MKYTVILLTAFIFYSCTNKESEKTDLKGKPLPSFNLLLQDSTTYFNTSSIQAGHPIVLFYFGPHCPYSKAQMEEIIDDISDLKNIQFYVFTTWPFLQMKEFVRYYQLNKYPNITVGLDYTNFFADYFKAQGVPYMAIYGKNKKLNDSFIGKIYSKQIKAVAEE